MAILTGKVIFILLVLESIATLSKQQPPSGIVSTTHQLKKLLAEEINNALGDLMCKVPEPTIATHTDSPSTNGQLEEIVHRLENKFDALITDPPCLGQIEEAVAGAFNESILAAILKRLDVLESEIIKDSQLGLTRSQAASTCKEILDQRDSSPSGYYWVKNAAGLPHRVYCDMTRSCGGVTGGWLRATKLDMTNSSHQCPSGLRQRIDAGIHTCGINSNHGVCSSVSLRVCGL